MAAELIKLRILLHFNGQHIFLTMKREIAVRGKIPQSASYMLYLLGQWEECEMMRKLHDN